MKNKQALDLEYWRALNPELNITDGGEIAPVKPIGVNERIIATIKESLLAEGYFQLDQILDTLLLDRLAAGVEKIREAGWPTPFVFVYDEYWQLMHPLKHVFESLLGPDVKLLPEFWCWHIDKTNDSKGIYPQRGRTAVQTIGKDHAPKSLRIWIPLTDTSISNGCLFALPANLDNDYSANLENRKVDNLQDIRAIPTRKGTVLGFTEALLHWGGRSSDKALHPSMTLSFVCQRGDASPYETPLLSPFALPSFKERLGLIAQNVNRFREEANPSPELIPVCESLTNLAQPIQETNGFGREVLETDARLSESRIWSINEQQRSTSTMADWEKPPILAATRARFSDNFADLIIAYLLDKKDELVEGEPIYILEAGGESGLFSYRFLTAFHSRLKNFESLKNLKIKHILSESSALIAKQWQQVHGLESMIADGHLDSAVFNPETENELHLINGNTSIRPGDLKNPLIVIANNSFSAYGQDAFWLEKDHLQEIRFTTYRDERESQLDRPARLEDLRTIERRFDVEGKYYDDNTAATILDDYRKTVGTGYVLFPIVTFKALDNLLKLANNRLALFAIDRGLSNAGFERTTGVFERYIRLHGAQSIPVNFDAIGRYFEAKGGSTSFSANSGYGLCTMASIIPATDKKQFEHLRYQFEYKLNDGEWGYSNKLALTMLEQFKVQGRPHPSLELFLAFLNASKYEPEMFSDAFEVMHEDMHEELSRIDTVQREHLNKALRKVAKNICLTDKRTLKSLERLLQFYSQLQMYDECLALCNDSLTAFGALPIILDHLAVCHENKGQVQLAHEFFRKSLEHNPNHAWAKDGLERTTKKLQAGA
jgi:hypothetical protein